MNDDRAELKTSYLDPKHGVVELYDSDQSVSITPAIVKLDKCTHAEAFGTLNSRHDAGGRKVTMESAVGSCRKRSR